MKRKTIRIDFRNFWEGFAKDNNFFIDMLKKDFNVILDEKNPEYVIFSVFETTELKKTKKMVDFIKGGYLSVRFKIKKRFYNALNRPYAQPFRMPAIKGEFVKIFYTAENVKPDMSKCDWAFSFYYNEDIKSSRHMRLPIYFFEGYDKKIIKKDINFKKIKKEKTKFCNFIYSNDVFYRKKFFKMLSEYKKIDAPGKCMRNIANKDGSNPVAIYPDPRNPYKNKLNFIKKYKFTIAFENSITSGYTTEKLVHPMMVNSIPIYFGNPKVFKDFNTKSFINIRDISDFKKVIKKIIKIDSNDKEYYKILKEPWYKNNKTNRYVNEKLLRERFKLIFK